jgi:hypothetical protein
MAWGSGGSGQLGDGSFNNQTTPVPVNGVSNAIGISAGTFFSLALLRDGTVVGFGSNQYNQLGSAATTNHDIPVPVSGVSGATQVTAGDQFSAALLSDGTALAWGANAHGALGNGTVGTTFSTVATPAPVVGLSRATAISAGGAHTLALTSSGAVAPPPPVLGKAVDVSPVSGHVFVMSPGEKAFVPLTGSSQIPVGSAIDSRAGTLQLTSATPRKNTTFTGTFGGAIFSISQGKSPAEKGLTTLQLVDSGVPGGPSYSRCTAPNRDAVNASVNSRVLQLLRANAHGKFATRGRYSAAAVRGTKWDTVERCDGTLVIVHRGTVVVTDFRRHKSIVVAAGQRYLAKAR